VAIFPASARAFGRSGALLGRLINVFEWLKGIRRNVPKLQLPVREDRVTRNQGEVDLSRFTPAPKEFIGQLEIMTAEIKFAPTTAAKAQLSEAAAKSFDKYRSLSRKLSTMGFDPTDAMDPYTERIDLFQSRTNGLDWYETVLKLYLTLGLLEEFYRKLAAGLPADVKADVEKALNEKTIEKFSKKVLTDAMAKDATLGSRLALWGRRIMGDVLLELRAAVPLASLEELEPLIAELNGPHSLRMDAIGLAA
jgi:tRNA-(MS[2]IO[6]A)-hydroxylase (MiaE)-like